MGIKARIIAVLLVLAAVFGAGWKVQGWRMGEDMAQFQKELAEARADAETAEREKEQALQARSDAIAAAILADMDAEQARARVVTKEVIKYVQVPGAGSCNLVDEWVHTHDRAARRAGGDPGAASVPDAGSGQFTDIDALVVVTDNYAICRQAMSQVRGWQAWYREVSGDAH